MGKARIKKEDMVIVIAGKDRDLSKPRRVLQVYPSEQRCLVEGANKIKRHTRPNPQKNIKGGVLEKEAPIHISNLAHIDPKDKTATRVGYKFLDDGRKVRFARRSGEVIDR